MPDQTTSREKLFNGILTELKEVQQTMTKTDDSNASILESSTRALEDLGREIEWKKKPEDQNSTNSWESFFYYLMDEMTRISEKSRDRGELETADEIHSLRNELDSNLGELGSVLGFLSTD